MGVGLYSTPIPMLCKHPTSMLGHVFVDEENKEKGQAAQCTTINHHHQRILETMQRKLGLHNNQPPPILVDKEEDEEYILIHIIKPH